MDGDLSTQRRRILSDDACAASFFDQDENISPTGDETHIVEIQATELAHEHQSSSLNCLKRPKLDMLTITYCENYKTSNKHTLYISSGKTLANLRERICRGRKWSPDETTLWYRHENQWKSLDEGLLSNTLDHLQIHKTAFLSITRTKREDISGVQPVSVPISPVYPKPSEEKPAYRRIDITQPANNRTVELEYNPTSNFNEFKQVVREKFDIIAPVDDLYFYANNIEIDNIDTLKNLSLAIVVVKQKPRSPPPQNRNGRVGLLNLGNTCFMNSALQCLSHILPLTNYFRRTPVEGFVASAYQNFVRQVWDGHQEIVDPREIKQTVSSYASRFSNFNQQDAREFLSVLLNRLDEDLRRNEQDTIITDLFQGQIDTVFSCSNCGKVLRTPNRVFFIPVPLKPKERIFTIVFIPFDRTNIQESICVPVIKSGCIKQVLENFVAQQPHANFQQLRVLSSQTNEELPYETLLSDVLDRQLTVVEEEGKLFSQCNNYDKDSRTLMDCLHDYLTPELLDNPWYCNGKCQRETNAVKHLELTVVPPVLVLQLERFTNMNGIRRKLEIFVDYPINELNLNDLSTQKDGKAIYNLVAVASHSGSIRGGHYVTCARQIDTDNWYRFSDSFVSPAQSSDVVSSDAYLLFYVQRFMKETAC